MYLPREAWSRLPGQDERMALGGSLQLPRKCFSLVHLNSQGRKQLEQSSAALESQVPKPQE